MKFIPETHSAHCIINVRFCIVSNLRIQSINLLAEVIVAVHVKLQIIVARLIREVVYAVNGYVYIDDIFIVTWNAVGFPQFPGYSPVLTNNIVISGMTR